MRVLVPEFILEKTDNVYTHLFVAYAYRLALKYGFREEYVMWAQDVRVLTQQYFTNNVTVVNYFEFLYPEMRCGLLGSNSFVFRFRCEPTARMVDITKPKACDIWDYLMKREIELNGELLEDDDKLIRIDRKDYQILPSEEFSKYTYYHDEDKRLLKNIEKDRPKRPYNRKKKPQDDVQE